MTKQSTDTAAGLAEETKVDENKHLPRVFIYKGQELQDTLPNETPEAVMKMLASHFPELANGEFTEEVKDEKRIIRFRKKATVNGQDYLATAKPAV